MAVTGADIVTYLLHRIHFLGNNLNTTYLEKLSMFARVKWPDKGNAQRAGFSGTVVIHQDSAQGPAHYRVRLRGLPPNSLHGFHIHEKPVTSQRDLEKTCQTCGGHFNPTNTYHGSVLNDNPDQRHVGDLINNVWADADGCVTVDFMDDMATLIETEQRPYTVLGKSLVVHEGVDDLGRQGTYEVPPFIDGRKPQVYYQKQDNPFTMYQDHRKRLESLKTGNAGKRLACGNIVEYAKSAWD